MNEKDFDYVCTQEQLGGPNWVQVSREEARDLHLCGCTVYWEHGANFNDVSELYWGIVGRDGWEIAFEKAINCQDIYKVEVE